MKENTTYMSILTEAIKTLFFQTLKKFVGEINNISFPKSLNVNNDDQ